MAATGATAEERERERVPSASFEEKGRKSNFVARRATLPSPDTKQRADQHHPLPEEDDNKGLGRGAAAELLLRRCVVRVHERHRKIQHLERMSCDTRQSTRERTRRHVGHHAW